MAKDDAIAAWEAAHPPRVDTRIGTAARGLTALTGAFRGPPRYSPGGP